MRLRSRAPAVETAAVTARALAKVAVDGGRAPAVVWVATIGYAALAASLSIRRHDAYLSGFDLAIFDQSLWLLANGYEPINTHIGISFWGEHFSLALLLLVPLYWLGAGPATLLLVQAGAIALAAPLLYALARAHGASSWLAVLPAVLWLASPLTLAANLFDVHHVPLVAPLVVGSVLALKHGRYAMFFALGGVACLAKEDVSLVYVMLGVVLMTEGRRRIGAATALAAAGVFVAATAIVLPAFSDIGAWQAKRFAGDRGETLGEAAVWMVTHPAGALADLVTAQNIGVFFALVLATGGLCLLAARWMLLAVPTLAFNLLSAYPAQHQLSTHYFVPAMIAFSIAAAVGVHKLPHLRAGWRVAMAVCVLTGLFAAQFGVARAWADSRWSANAVESTGGPQTRREALALVPSGVPVAATPRLSAHLSQRREIYTLPLPFLGRQEVGADWSDAEMAARADRVTWVVMDSADGRVEFPAVPERIPPLLVELGFRVVFRSGTVTVYKRGSPT